MIRKTAAEFENSAGLRHEHKYIYSGEYTNGYTKIPIVCKIHGVFYQTPDNHLNGRGCPKCGQKSSSQNHKYTVDEFEEKAKITHNNNYIYYQDYFNSHDKIRIGCLVHGDFYQTPKSHLQGANCPGCGRKKSRSKRITQLVYEFEEKAKATHHNRYCYNGDFSNSDLKTKITCRLHGDFYQKACAHLSGQGCPKCRNEENSIRKNSSSKDFEEKANYIHNGKYSYFNNYIDSKTKIAIKCPIHGVFYQTPTTHLRGSGCSICNLKYNEKLVNNFLKENIINYTKQYMLVVNNKKLRCDFYIPEINLIIEYNGAQHYRPVKFGGMTDIQAEFAFKKQTKRDCALRAHCAEAKINLLEIDGRKYTKEKLLSYLTNYFGVKPPKNEALVTTSGD